MSDPASLVPAHGNGRLRPWQAGQSGNPGGRSRALAEALALARTNAPAMVAKLLDLAENSPDERVQAMAAIKLLEISEVQHLAATPESTGSVPDLRHLTPADRRALADALRVVKAMTGKAGELLAAAEAVVDRGTEPS